MVCLKKLKKTDLEWNNDLWGESWIGLDTLHSLTNQYSYKLKIILTDFEDPKKYVAVYDQFQVNKLLSLYKDSL